MIRYEHPLNERIRTLMRLEDLYQRVQLFASRSAAPDHHAALLALLEGGVWKMVAVIVVYCAINFVIQSVIQPKFQADALNLGVSVTFLSLVFWTFVLGPLGALLALPMTLFVRAVLVDADPTVRWVEPLLSNSLPPDDPPDAAAPPATEPATKPAVEDA